MKVFILLINYLKEWLQIIFWFFNVKLKKDKNKEFEIVLLRMELAYYKKLVEDKKLPKARTSVVYKQFWVLLSKYYKGWKDLPKLVTTRTILSWHNTAFKFFWGEKSKAIGRPKISKKIKSLIRSIHSENPLLSPEKIREMLLNMNYTHVPSANKIRDIIGTNNKKPPSEKQIQSWKTFLKNHKEIWAMDFFVVPTLTFRMLFVLVIINHDSRKIEHFGVTYNPNSIWLIQQFREATPYDQKPKYLIHDNDPVFRSKDFQDFLESSQIKSKRTAYRSPWQNGIGERVIGSIRRELTDHVIPINEHHLDRLMKEYVDDYYNTHRTHQGIECNTPMPSPEYEETSFSESKMIPKEILGGLYHTYKKVA